MRVAPGLAGDFKSGRRLNRLQTRHDHSSTSSARRIKSGLRWGVACEWHPAVRLSPTDTPSLSLWAPPVLVESQIRPQAPHQKLRVGSVGGRLRMAPGFCLRFHPQTRLRSVCGRHPDLSIGSTRHLQNLRKLRFVGGTRVTATGFTRTPACRMYGGAGTDIFNCRSGQGIPLES